MLQVSEILVLQSYIVVYHFPAQRQSQNNTLRHQAKDLEFSIAREERFKKEIEVYLTSSLCFHSVHFFSWLLICLKFERNTIIHTVLFVFSKLVRG